MRDCSMVLTVSIVTAGCGGSTDREGGGDCVGLDEDGNATLCEPENGFQMATPAFEVPEGAEVQDCYFFSVPFRETGDPDEPYYVDRIEVAQNAGTHHMNIFRVTTINDLSTGATGGSVVYGSSPGADGEAPGECWRSANWGDWPLVFNSQQSTADGGYGYEDWRLPETGDGRQVVYELAPGEPLMLQTHYVNATTQDTPLRGRVLVSFHFADPADVGPRVHTVFGTHQSIEIVPAPPDEDQSFLAGCNFEHPDLTIIGANSHFHGRGKRFTISTGTPDGDAAETFYDNDSWDDPLMARDLSVPLAADRPLLYECTYNFPAGCPEGCEPLDVAEPSCGRGAQCASFGFEAACGNSFCFGPRVETMEHCNVFVYLYADEDDPAFEENFVGHSDLNCF